MFALLKVEVHVEIVDLVDLVGKSGGGRRAELFVERLQSLKLIIVVLR